MTLSPQNCSWCREPVKQGWHAPFCSRRCKRADTVARNREDGKLPPVVAWAPTAWDGTTLYSVVPEPVHPYDRTCGLCGRQQGETELMTHKRAGRLGLAGLPPCSTCHGFVLMDLVTIGGLGAPHSVVLVR